MVSCVGQNFQGALDFKVRNDDGTGPGQPSGDQCLQAGRVPKYHRVAGDSGLAHPVWIKIKRDIRYVFLVEHARQILSAATVAANDDMFVGLDRLARNGGHLQGLLQPFAADPFQNDLVAVHDDKWRG